MRAFERQPAEGNQAYRAFAIFRDLGEGRTLRQAAALHYHGTTTALPTNGQLSNIKKWSAAHDWVARARSFDDILEMHANARLEEHLKERADDHARRRADLAEKSLELAERAAEQAVLMLRWPLAERSYEDDGQTVRITPAKWSKANIRSFYEIVVAGATGSLPSPDPDEGSEVEFDFSELSEAELQEYVRISEKLGVKRRD